jgi:hypothetical protein
MKTGHTKFFSNWLWVILLLPCSLQAQYEKNYQESFSAASTLSIKHQRGELRVVPSPNNQVRYELNVTFDARSQEDADRVLDAIRMDARSGGNHLSLTTETGIKNMQTINGRSSITLKDGTKIKGVKDMKMSLVVYTPKVRELMIEDKYNDIEVASDLATNLNATLYSSEANIGRITGSLTLDAKYSEIDFQSMGDADLTIYDCEITMQGAGAIKLASKYSEIRATTAASLEADLYDDDVEMERVEGTVSITDKYSEIMIKACGNTRLDLYDSEISIAEVGNMTIKSKYTEFKLGRAYVIDFDVTYDDDCEVESATSLTADNSKYTTFVIDELTSKLIMESYDDEVKINRLGSKFAELSFNGKYTDLVIGIPGSFAYQIDMSTKYGDLQVDEDDFDFIRWVEKNGQIEAIGKTKNAGTQSPLFKIRGYDNNIRIN